ncbi:MAG: hypothetical protein V7752_18995 [Halopseudomonas sp.]
MNWPDNRLIDTSQQLNHGSSGSNTPLLLTTFAHKGLAAMLILTRQQHWQWKPTADLRSHGGFSYRNYALGHWQLAIVNRRLMQLLQQQIRRQVEERDAS